MQSEQINEIAKALSMAQSEMKSAKKDAKNPFFKSDYATLESVSEACLPALNKQAIAVTQLTNVSQDGLTQLITLLIHSSGQWISSTYPVHPTKNDPQALGSALTYARRYSLAAIAGVVTSDDDGESAMDRDNKPQEKITYVPKEKITYVPRMSGPTEGTNAVSGVLSQKQLSRLFAISKKAGWSEQDVRDYLKAMGLTSTKELNTVQYEHFCKKMEQFPKG